MDIQTPTLQGRAHPGRRSARRTLAAALTGVTLAATMMATAPTTAQAARIPPRCTVAQLRVQIGYSQGAAGTLFYMLRFTNLGRSTCSLRGFPGVSLTDARGHRLGRPAVWERGWPVQRVTLTRGATAHSIVAVHNATAYPVSVCRPATSSFVRVYPPGSDRSVLVRFGTLTCTTALDITAVTPVTAGRGTP